MVSISLQIFQKLCSRNFTWSTIEYFALNVSKPLVHFSPGINLENHRLFLSKYWIIPIRLGKLK